MKLEPSPSVETPVAEPSTDLDSPLPGLSLPSAEPSFPDTPEAPAGDSLTTELPSFDPIPAPESAPAPAPDLPILPAAAPETVPVATEPAFEPIAPEAPAPSLPSDSLPDLPGLPAEPTDIPEATTEPAAIPSLPEAAPSSDGLPPLPGIDAAAPSSDALPPLPGGSEMLSHLWMICLAYPCLRKAHQVMIYHHFLDFLENLPEICLHYLEQEQMTYHLFPTSLRLIALTDYLKS